MTIIERFRFSRFRRRASSTASTVILVVLEGQDLLLDGLVVKDQHTT